MRSVICKMIIGNTLEYVKLLLYAPVINPDIANYAGQTPIEVTYNYSCYINHAQTQYAYAI